MSYPELGSKKPYTNSVAGTRVIRGYTLNLDGNAFHVLNGKGEWTSLNSETTGTALGSGNGVTKVFTIAHGLGVVPYCAFVQVSSEVGSDISISWDYDESFIIIKFKTAPEDGNNNITFQWRAVAP